MLLTAHKAPAGRKGQDKARKGRGYRTPQCTMNSFLQWISNSPQLCLNGFVSETTNSTPRKPNLSDLLPRSSKSLRSPGKLIIDTQGTTSVLIPVGLSQSPQWFSLFLCFSALGGRGTLAHMRAMLGVSAGSIQGTKCFLPKNFIETFAEEGEEEWKTQTLVKVRVLQWHSFPTQWESSSAPQSLCGEDTVGLWLPEVLH